MCLTLAMLSTRLTLLLATAALALCSCTTPSSPEQPDPQTPAPAAPTRAALSETDNQLLQACLAHNKAEVSRLLAQGANPNARNPVGRTALMAVALGAPTDANSSAEVDWGSLGTATLKAVDAAEMCRGLLDKGADINAQDDQGYSALMLASLQGNSALVSILLTKGANPALKSEEGLTAHEIATAKGRDSVVDVFADQ